MSLHRRYRQLDRLYAAFPVVHCRGLCGRKVCGPIALSKLERQRIIEQAGERQMNGWHCPYLTADARCGVYAIRPAICRIYGAVTKDMECEYGCQVTPGPITADQARQLLRQVSAIAGHGTVLAWDHDVLRIADFEVEHAIFVPCSVCGERAVYFDYRPSPASDGNSLDLHDARCWDHSPAEKRAEYTMRG